MRILYLSLSYVPSRRASSVQVMRMCEAFAAAGHDVTLIAKRHDEPAAHGGDVHAFYGVAPEFTVELVARPPRRGGGVLYAAGMIRRVLRSHGRVDLVYSRDLIGAFVATQLGMPVAFEAHGIFDRPWQQALWRRMVASKSFRGLVVISQAMAQQLAALALLPRAAPVVVAHSPARTLPGVTPRATVASPPRVGYIGSLYPGRGVELIVELAGRMPACRFEIVGGSQADLAHWQTVATPANLAFLGFVPPGALPALCSGFDVLLMPYPRQGIHGATRRLDTAAYCSPMKMFEYMASGVPMVASDLPVLQEVIGHERNALIAPSGDAAAWQAAIDRLLAEPALRVAIAERALADVERYTPTARTALILGGLGFAR